MDPLACLAMRRGCGSRSSTPRKRPFLGSNGLLTFNSDRDGDFELFTMHADGSGETVRTSDPASDRKPVWSPDGKRLAFMSNRDGDFDIYVMNLDGRSLTRITNGPGSDFNPTWSPDGRLIAFNSDRSGDFEVYVVTARWRATPADALARRRFRSRPLAGRPLARL